MKHSRLTSLVAYITDTILLLYLAGFFHITYITNHLVFYFFFSFTSSISSHLWMSCSLPPSISCLTQFCQQAPGHHVSSTAVVSQFFFFVFVSNHQTPWNDINLDTHIESAKKIGTIKQNKHKVRQHKYPSKQTNLPPAKKKRKK